MAIKYSKITQSKALQKLPSRDFGFENKPSGNPDRFMYFFGDVRV
jgi:hypothetical protein